MYLCDSFIDKYSKLESWNPPTIKYLKNSDKIVLGPLLNKRHKKQKQEFWEVSEQWSHWLLEASTD